jgi:CubicO group peptidase (beta-lactamase class C family)
VVSGGKILGAVVTAAGSGYREPPVVRIPPGDHIVNTVPVWAAAGALKSSARDLLRIAQLYLGQPEVGGQPVPPALTAGARYALQPLVQNAPAVRTEFTGMTWEIDTGPIAGGLNALAGKDGALPGFATYVTLVPAVNLGVVILRSNNQAGQAEYADPIGDVANAIALAVQLALMAEESP